MLTTIDTATWFIECRPCLYMIMLQTTTKRVHHTISNFCVLTIDWLFGLRAPYSFLWPHTPSPVNTAVEPQQQILVQLVGLRSGNTSRETGPRLDWLLFKKLHQTDVWKSFSSCLQNSVYHQMEIEQYSPKNIWWTSLPTFSPYEASWKQKCCYCNGDAAHPKLTLIQMKYVG